MTGTQKDSAKDESVVVVDEVNKESLLDEKKCDVDQISTTSSNRMMSMMKARKERKNRTRRRRQISLKVLTQILLVSLMMFLVNRIARKTNKSKQCSKIFPSL